MRNIRAKITITTIMTVITAVLSSHVYAADLSVRLSEPKSPTNLTNFDLGFVALDIQNRAITVKCFKKSPSDAGYTQFGSDITLPAGGNSSHCSVTSSIFGPQGTYSFKVEATAGGDTATDTQDVDYDTSGPGDVKDYNKSRNACEYTIHFKTADDSGATTKVELYRSDSVPFYADHNSRIQSITIGSNTTKDTTDTPPDCSKDYYYAVRAYDAAGNGSALVGDNVTTTTVITPTPGAESQGAIPVSSTGGNVLGKSTQGAEKEGQVEGMASQSAQEITIPSPTANKPYYLEHPKRALAIAGGIFVVVGAALYVFWQKRKNQTSP